jgi:hypothetical protein
MEKTYMKKTALILATLLLMAGRGFASAITVDLASPMVTAHPGDALLFLGTLVNNDMSTVDLNSISVSLDGMFLTDITPFFSGPATIDMNTSSTFTLFQVTVLTPYTDPYGTHTGTVTIEGGVEGPGGYDPTTQNPLGSASFQVNVQPSPVPEPTSAGLVLAVIAAMPVVYFRRRCWFAERLSGRNK